MFVEIPIYYNSWVILFYRFLLAMIYLLYQELVIKLKGISYNYSKDNHLSKL